jgi:hypothetical protein
LALCNGVLGNGMLPAFAVARGRPLMTDWRGDLVDTLTELRALLAAPEADYLWSSWNDADDALQEVDGIIAGLRAGEAPAGRIASVFLPTGPAQEVAVPSGWGDHFLTLAARVDAALATCAGSLSRFSCSLCPQQAGVIELVHLDGRVELQRRSFTGHLTATPTDLDPVRAAIRADDVRALHAMDAEYTPFYCPTCDACFCADHWQTRDIFDNGWHDSIRGTCPRGHERLLED